jgi:hypothetical protein
VSCVRSAAPWGRACPRPSQGAGTPRSCGRSPGTLALRRPLAPVPAGPAGGAPPPTESPRCAGAHRPFSGPARNTHTPPGRRGSSVSGRAGRRPLFSRPRRPEWTEEPGKPSAPRALPGRCRALGATGRGTIQCSLAPPQRPPPNLSPPTPLAARQRPCRSPPSPSPGADLRPPPPIPPRGQLHVPPPPSGLPKLRLGALPPVTPAGADSRT